MSMSILATSLPGAPRTEGKRAPAVGRMAETGQTDGAADKQPAIDLSAPSARDLFGDFEAEAARSRKSFAEERLKTLKEQMKTLMLFTLVPGALSNQTARMARELEGAAEDFTGSVKTLARTTPAPADGADTAGASAYASVLADGALTPVTLSSDDRETVEGFAHVARFLADASSFSDSQDPVRAERDRQGERTRDSSTRVLELMGSLSAATVLKTLTL